MKFYVVAYDIPDDKRRLQVAKRLEQAGTRVQGSVFEVPVAREGSLLRLRRDLAALVGPGDSLRFYRLCPGCRESSFAVTGEPVAVIPGFMLV